MVLCLAYADRLPLCMAMVATATALCGGVWDAAGMLVVLNWADEGWIHTAIASTVAYAVWVKDSRKICLLPDFATFLARLRPYPSSPERSREKEERGCLLCFSWDKKLFRLPCHPSHRLCKTCLSHLHEADRCHCPHCNTALFIFKSETEKVRLRYFIRTNTILALTFGSILVALQLYKGHYRSAGTVMSTMLFCSPAAWYSLCMLGRQQTLENVDVEALWSIHGMAWCFVFGAAMLVQLWDQVTLWDGAVLNGAETWDTYPDCACQLAGMRL